MFFPITTLLVQFLLQFKPSTTATTIQECLDTEIRPIIYHKIKSCHKSTKQITFWKHVNSLEVCKAVAKEKNGLAFNFSPPEAVNFTKFMPNCQILGCPEIGNDSNLVMDIGYDYYSAYGNFNLTENATCVKSLGLFSLTPDYLNYSQSILACQNTINGDLADIATEYRTTMLSELIKNQITDWYQEAYVGLDNLLQKRVFRNSLGMDLTCSKSWAPGHPRSKHLLENCVTLDSKRLWRVVHCGKVRLRGLCELYFSAPILKENSDAPRNVTCNHISEKQKVKKKKCLQQKELFEIFENATRADKCALLNY